jgi:hypothetical protein
VELAPHDPNWIAAATQFAAETPFNIVLEASG